MKKISLRTKDTLSKNDGDFASKYPDRGYLIVVDEFLDYLGLKKHT